MGETVDTHFLIDSAPPREVEYLLRSLSLREACSLQHLRERLFSAWHYSAQKNLSLSTRRLLDLHLCLMKRTPQGKPGYLMSPLGAKVRSILEMDRDLYADVMHYLHYDGYDGTAGGRKLFWSYKYCSDMIWLRKEMPPTPRIVAEVQSQIAQQFPEAYSQRIGGNYNKGGVTAWKAWLADLACPPIIQGETQVTARVRPNPELAALALDHVYRARCYRYGDPVVLDEPLLDELARVFFLTHDCYRDLLAVAAKITRIVSLRDTFAGTSINLLEPYTIERI